MAQKKFTQLPNAGALTGDEIFAMVQAGASVQETLNAVAAFIGGSSFGNQAANLVFAGPAAGGAAAPAFRALVTADMPASVFQDLQDVLDQGSVAAIVDPIEMFSDGYIQIKSTTDVVSIESATSGFFAGATAVISAGGVAYPWPTSAPAGNGYAVTVDTDGTVNFVPFASGITIGTTTITSGTDTRILYNNSGVVGEYAQVPVAVGGTGAATLTGLLQGNGTSAFTAIADSSTVGQVLRVTGASTYAWGALDLADSDAVTGILPVANGGSGSSSVVWWALTGTSTLTGNVTIACGTNTLAFTSTAVENPFSFSATYTADDSNDTIVRVTGTLTSRGTSNDVISAMTWDAVLANSTGTGITHVGARFVNTSSGSTNPSNSIQILSVALGSQSNAETFRGTNSSGITRQQLFGDGRFIFTQTTTGSEHAGTMATNAANGAGVITESMQISGSITTAHTHFWRKMTGGVTSNATNLSFYSYWDMRSVVAGHTGLTYYAIYLDPQFSGAQAANVTNYAVIAASGLSGFGVTAPTARLQARGVNNAVAFLAEDDSGNAIASFGESGGARVIGFFGATPVVQQTMGSATAGGAYTATEQAMLQAVYDAVRNIGIGT